MTIIELQEQQVPTVSPSAVGARIYHGKTLNFYDFLVGYLSCTWIWDCPRERQLDLYNRYLSDNHLEVGPATGWFLNHARLRHAAPKYTLLDLNPISLAYAEERLARFTPRIIQADILDPIPVQARFKSASMNFVLHCLPGTMHSKGRAVFNIAQVLTDDGILFGTTLLGKPLYARPQAKILNYIYNRCGIFSNERDSLEELRRILENNFHEVTIDEHWSGALFIAKYPKRDQTEVLDDQNILAKLNSELA